MGEDAPTFPDDLGSSIGSYVLEHQLGSGGMSSVFRAVHSESGLVVAVKILPRNLARNPSLLQRFLREAKSAESLEHPNIAAIYDRGVDQGRHYLVLEYVEGGDLHDRVKLQGPLPVDDAVAVIRAVADGLEFAASRGMIHRDIKPANLLLAPDGRVKIIDLGLALQAEAEDERVTRDGTTVGTVDYMAPEQARDSRATSVRSDIYSLGCTFHYLLTGSPPYAGGDIADKLSRHFTQPPPDPRVLRPEVPETIARIVLKMMAKRPERRYQDYEELQTALDSHSGRSTPIGELTLDALVVEDDEPGTGPDEAGGDPPAEISLAELAELDEKPASSRPRPTPPRVAVAPAPVRSPDMEPEPELTLDAIIEEADDRESDEEGPLYDEVAEAEAPIEHASMRKWVIACSIAGVCVILLIVGVHQLLIGAGPVEPMPVAEASLPPPEPEVAEPEPAPPPVRPPAPKPQPEPIAVAVAAPVPTVPRVEDPPVPALPSARTEPEDLDSHPRPESPLPPDLEGRFLPAWAREAIADRLPGSFSTVRRVSDPKDAAQRPTLRLALDSLGGTVQIEDPGPWFESDLRVFGESRQIRSHPGSRAMIALERAELDAVRDQPAPVVLEGKNLILDGIDFVVDVRDLRRGQTALFVCRSGALTMRNSSITVLNPSGQPFSIIRVEGSPRPSRIRIENSLMRGSAQTIVELTGGAAEVVVQRSVLVGGAGPLIVSPAQEGAGERKIWLLRSLLAGRGPIFDVTGSGAKPAPSSGLSVQALGTTFARFDGAGGTSLIALQTDPGPRVAPFAWSGDDNRFAGWNEWLVAGPNRVVRAAGAPAARALWPGSDARSRDDAAPWTEPGRQGRLAATDLALLAPELAGTFDRVARPNPFLLEQTVETFPKPNPPQVEPIASFTPAPTVATPEPGQPAPPAIRELALGLEDPPWRGDLGLYVRDQIREGDRRLRVRVQGTGSHPLSPIKLPTGVSLEIVVEPPTMPESTPPVWTPMAPSPVDAIIDVRGADLRLSGVRIVRGPSASCATVLRVEDGHLVLERCRLYSSASGPSGGSLIAFRAPSTRAFERGPGPFSTVPDRPIGRVIDSVLISGGDVLAAEVGKGLLSFSNCLIAATGTAFALHPCRVARGRFEATLALDRCTVAAERNFVLLGPWNGREPGPDRPWLISAHDSAFLDQYDRPVRESVLLRIGTGSLSRGLLFWQANNSAFEVAHFTARDDSAPVAVRRPDVRKQWIDLWGEGHMRRVSGPGRANAPPSVRFLARIGVGGAVAPGDLALDPAEHPGRNELDVGADLDRLQVRPTHPPRRR